MQLQSFADILKLKISVWLMGNWKYAHWPFIPCVHEWIGNMTVQRGDLSLGWVSVVFEESSVGAK